MSQSYDAGRAIPEEWVAGWRFVLAEFLAEIRRPVVDVGSGTGIWAKMIAEWFGVDVVGVEPSVGMRSRAIEYRPHPRVHYVGGKAEHLPLRDASCDAAWMSTVVHHFADLVNAARDVRRVVTDGGPVLVRQSFSGRHDGILWTRAFPSALRLAEDRHPTIEAVLEAFEKADFRQHEVRSVTEVVATDLHHYVRKKDTHRLNPGPDQR
jgi:ubiquinone/menaquinone biosynthesis C-methylase UbiE